MTDIQYIPVASLQPHPDNPRLQLREDVIERIAAEIARTDFGPEHAPLVRPYGDALQIISGHHRIEAATRAGLTEVPCWIKEMDDDEAFMQLVLSNTQGELSPLEIGMHALKAVPPAERKAGYGFKAYAERIGVTGAYIGQLHAAAEVITTAKLEFSSVASLSDKAKHLYEVSKARRQAWSALVEGLISKSWSVKDVADHVDKIKAFNIPDRHVGWLPLNDIVRRYLSSEFSPRTVARLIAVADDVYAWIDANGDEHDLETFQLWLVRNRGNDSWDYRQIIAYHQRLLAGRFIVKGWHHGSWSEHVDDLADGSVSLLLTDPPYGMAYQSNRRGERHDELHGDDTDAMDELRKCLEALWPKLADDAHLLVFCTAATEFVTRAVIADAGYTYKGSPIWDKESAGMGDLAGTFGPSHERIVHAVKGQPKMVRRIRDVLRSPRTAADRHPTEKPVDLLVQLIEATTATGQIVADPFSGVASTCVAAKDAGRKWWGCEIEEKYWRAGEERLS